MSEPVSARREKLRERVIREYEAHGRTIARGIFFGGERVTRAVVRCCKEDRQAGFDAHHWAREPQGDR